MELQGEVLKRFTDKKTKITYAPKGEIDVEEYTEKKTTYPHIYKAEKERYEYLYNLGYVKKGSIVEKRKKYEIEEE